MDSNMQIILAKHKKTKQRITRNAIIASKRNQYVPNISSFTESITKTQLEQVLNERLKPLEEKLDKFIQRDSEFKRRMELKISQMYERQEITLNIHDGLKAFLQEWFGKD